MPTVARTLVVLCGLGVSALMVDHAAHGRWIAAMFGLVLLACMVGFAVWLNRPDDD